MKPSLFVLFHILKSDWNSNFTFRNPKPFFVLFCFRVTCFFASFSFFPIKLVFYPIRIFYRVIIEWIMGIEIPDTTKIGFPFIIHHGVGLVINPNAVIGNNVVVRHSTTIGNIVDLEGKSQGSPKIGDNVDIGSNCVIIGNIIIGNNVRIGAGSVIVKDVPDNVVVVGNPARIVKHL